MAKFYASEPRKGQTKFKERFLHPQHHYSIIQISGAHHKALCPKPANKYVKLFSFYFSPKKLKQNK